MKLNVLGPLGHGFEVSQLKGKENIFIAGGVGYASLLPMIDLLDEVDLGRARLFYGVRTDLERIRLGALEAEMMSDDGTAGRRGRIHEALKNQNWRREAQFFVCGPTPMMKAVHSLLPADRSFYFLEETMGCGFGLCVGCVVVVDTSSGPQRVKSCLEGPHFRGDQLVSWQRGER
jgi:dihydroorotate dehydrogenase electron transfer subunit